MTLLTIQNASQRSRLSEPTLRYYEEVGLIGPIARDERSGHRRYRERDLDDLQVLACLRAMGVGIEDMRTYQANRAKGREAAGEQRDILNRHARRIEQEIETLGVHLRYLEAKAGLWDARDRGDAAEEAVAADRVNALLGELEAVMA
ncbi:MerR family transcriptional regulator [Subtercola boreus]|uniref:MerR family transcriptional regulator n=1 Tax=Subtercola boreus TaxID=120213 RepID=A0A3E0VH71_9MICO|nr:MerR family transcriptional regulator [Subtercola boreus]RFA09009.1 MerR family transcriptional regulator [Subtercola boreus]TQL53992.1 DNA-binding transcriptional MerR regulator [Subtercola boreus]